MAAAALLALHVIAYQSGNRIRYKLLCVPRLHDKYEDALANKLPVPPFPQAQGFMAGAAPVWRIRAEATMPDGVTFVRDAVLRPSVDPRRPMIALLWQEGARTPAPPPSTENGDTGAPTATGFSNGQLQR